MMGRKRKFYESREFRQTQQAWYLRLESEGFEDIERQIGGELVLCQSSDHPLRFSTEVQQQTKLSLYIQLGRCLNTYELDSHRDRIIMQLVADGVRIKNILEVLKTHGYTLHRNTVRFIIRKYESRWMIRQWLPRQMSSNYWTPKRQA